VEVVFCQQDRLLKTVRGQMGDLKYCPNQLLVPYHALMRNPRHQLDRIAHFLDPDNLLPQVRLDWVLKIQNIEQKTTAFGFRYCDLEWIGEIENELDTCLERSSIPRLV
jgi:transketolase N-terminal domain/subunit